ncbi:Calx-beta domain-containing protein [Lishizhenia tianjinensis]|uniref:Calx-beta domain-containing protein n=1 Tax=Lishizhenia tianjinensis TaxID=477690 RepID=A0A1I7AWT3_9FLAO|nr:choice-of-anchor L domain-containing protein [Lishizhenia tianjinensis]SFT79369.1 Calx-beta domain-containing protein [Lishizhenia tianjinensis]
MRSLIVILLILSQTAFGQLVTTANTPNNLVQNVLLGTGVQISNINYVGSPGSIGYFNGANTNIGLDEGVILTTGTIANSPAGPHGPNNQASAGVSLNGGGFTKLDALVNGSSTFDATILEFDFIPFSDTVKFNYVFASEEYPEFVNSEFNDVFAFFISGPGIPGGEKNMAIIPGTNDPVAINNVNNGFNNNGNCTNCAYYVNNGNGSTFPENSNNYYVQYDGFTTPLQAISAVECGETYHLIIAIADVGDGLYDSGIFLEANSLSSESPVTIDYELSSLAFGSSNIMAEGCVDATFEITRHGYRVNQAETITIATSGTATEGVDYTNIPNSINFAAGQVTQTFTFTALADGIAEGQENIILDFFIADACGNNNAQTFELFINDLENVEVEVADETVTCPGELVQLTAVASGGGGSLLTSGIQVILPSLLW